MANIYTSFTQLIGATPLLHLKRLCRERNLSATVLAKLEGMNPAGSVKDRAAMWMILNAEEKGLLKPGSVIIEPTSGNTGIGLAAVAAVRGYRCIIVMPDSMSAERQMLMRAYGAEVVLTPGALGMQGAVDKAKELSSEMPNSFIPDQFNNPANADAHYRTTGPEIWDDTDGKVDIFVAGVGTGGTITGIGRFLKEKNPDVKIVAVEPASSPLLSKGLAGKHSLQGIGANFIPGVLDTAVYDAIIPVTEEEAFAAAKALRQHEAVLAGISSGAALHAALTLAQKAENAGKNIVVLLPDSGERYLSTDLYK